MATYFASFSVRHYRIWIYTLNTSVSVLSILFLFTAHFILQDEKLAHLFSIRISNADFWLIYIYIGPVVQVFVCLFGILLALANRPVALQTYWYIAGALIVFDICVGLAWIPKFKEFHQQLPNQLRKMIQAPPNAKFCHVWNKMQKEFSCCGVYSYKDWFSLTSFCQEPLFDNHRLPHSCCAYNSKFCNQTSSIPEINLGSNSASINGDEGCMGLLLKWLHGRADILFMLGYCTLFTAKIISLIILKREIRELLNEIYHERELAVDRRLSDCGGLPAGVSEEDFIDLRKEWTWKRIGNKAGTDV